MECTLWWAKKPVDTVMYKQTQLCVNPMALKMKMRSSTLCYFLNEFAKCMTWFACHHTNNIQIHEKKTVYPYSFVKYATKWLICLLKLFYENHFKGQETSITRLKFNLRCYVHTVDLRGTSVIVYHIGLYLFDNDTIHMSSTQSVSTESFIWDRPLTKSWVDAIPPYMLQKC